MRSALGLGDESGCLLHAILELDLFGGVEDGSVVTLAKSELATDLGHGCDDLEHELLLGAGLVHFDL